MELLKNRHTKRTEAPTFYRTVDQFNYVTRAIATAILSKVGIVSHHQSLEKDRADQIAIFVALATVYSRLNPKRLVELQNFNSAQMIVAGLQHSAISRLRKSWVLLKNKTQAEFDSLVTLFVGFSV